VNAAKIFNSKAVLVRAEQEATFTDKYHVRTLFVTDDDFPQRLKHCHDSPILLYYKGTADLNSDRIIGVVGTRTPTDHGRQLTEKMIADLEGTGSLIVSGLAYGIDYAAHKAAYAHKLDTVGVLAHGLDRMYPQAHRHFAKDMMSQGGLLTDFMSETNPDKENFPKRNRIVAGLCDALVVMESKKGGGSLITATIANSYNKDVFAFPGRPGDIASEGCNGLIKTNKAALIESAADLLYMMGWDQAPAEKPKQQIPLSISLSDEEQKILAAFSERQQVHIDEVCQATQFTVSKASTLLLQLEFSNMVRSLPGRMYRVS
jgi:DNA processing protein